MFKKLHVEGIIPPLELQIIQILFRYTDDLTLPRLEHREANEQLAVICNWSKPLHFWLYEAVVCSA